MRKHLRLAVAGTAARAAAGIVAIGLFAGTGLADPIAALDHAEYAERERASERLIEAVNGELKRLEAMIRDRELTPEQRARLESIGWEIFQRGPRAGMGVSFGGEVPRGVQIGGTVPGFDAADVLAAEDIILEMNGQELDSVDTMRYLIVARDPGDVMRLKVQRQGRVIDAAVRMGAFAQLDARPQQIVPDVMENAWKARLGEWPEAEHRVLTEARLSGPAPATNPFVSSEGFDRWLAHGEPLPPRLTGGGEPTGGLAPCGRLRVRVAGRDLLMPPIPDGLDALRASEQRAVGDTVRAEFSHISGMNRSHFNALRDRMINADAEERERIAETMQLLDERRRNAENRVNEVFDLYDRMPRGR